jgi:hypothetical protein
VTRAVHYAGALRWRNLSGRSVSVLAGGVACTRGRRAEKIRAAGEHTHDVAAVTCHYCRERMLKAGVLQLPPRRCQASTGMVMCMGQPRFGQCGKPSTHHHPHGSPGGYVYPLPLCPEHAEKVRAAGREVLEGDGSKRRS